MDVDNGRYCPIYFVVMFNYHIMGTRASNNFLEARGVFNMRSAQYKVESDVFSLLYTPLRPLPSSMSSEYLAGAVDTHSVC